MPQTGLIKRNSTYYLRLRVPTDLVPHYGKAEFKISLKTKERSDAITKLRVELARLEHEFTDIRKRAKQAFVIQELASRRVTSLDDETIDAIAASWLEQNLAADDLLRSSGDSGDMEEDIRQTLAILRPAYARGDITSVEQLVQQFVSMLGIELSVNEGDWRKLCLKFMEAYLQAAQIRARRLEGEAISTAVVMAQAPRPLAPPTAQAAGTSLAQVLERWQTVADRRPRTVAEMTSLVGRFEQYSNHKPVKALTRQDGIGFRDHMREQDKVSPGTVKKNLGLITSLLNFAVDEGVISANPFARIKVPQSKTAALTRLEYSPEDLATIFQCPLYTKGLRPRGGGREAAVWLPLIAAFSGARLEEIAQLRPEDLIEDSTDGWYFSVLDLDDDQHLKTDSSRRRVPVHPALIKAGLIDYRAFVQAKKQQWLLPGLVPHVNGTRSGNWSKWWGRFAREKIGIEDRRKVFHSFRHAFKTACRAANIPEDVHDALTGHSSASIGRKYGQQPLGVLRRAMNKIKYPGVTPPVGLWPPRQTKSESRK